MNRQSEVYLQAVFLLCHYSSNNGVTMSSDTSSILEHKTFITRFVYWMAVLFALAHVYANTIGTFSELWVSALHFGGFALLTALIVPLVKSSEVHRRSTWQLGVDLCIGIAAVASAVY